MQISTFKHEFMQLAGIYITPDAVLLKKPMELYDLKEKTVIAAFDSLDEALAYPLHGKSLAARIAEIEEITFIYDGGRGGGSGLSSFKFGSAGGSGGAGSGRTDLPARMNVRMSGAKRSPDDALRAFREAHANDKYESAVTVDQHGFVTRYTHGNATSVRIAGSKGEMVYHNHPSGGNFSDKDLVSVSMGAERGIVASGKFGDYKFVKTPKFKASAFIKAVKTARMTGKDYSDAANRWLKANQKKYGYKYSFTPAK